MKKQSWQKDFKEASNAIPLLKEHLQLKEKLTLMKGGHFQTKVPASFISRINPNDPKDPLLLQVVKKININNARGTNDPLNERALAKDGLIKKYKSRALIITTQACPIHCQYCFRQHFNYADNLSSKDNYNAVIKTIHEDDALNEVILSGGDPLSLSNHKLGSLLNKIDNIEHIKTIRLHTRFPIAIPSRINDKFINILGNIRANLVVVIHCNHPNEIDSDVKRALLKLSELSKLTLLNQSVLLKDINDSASTLIKLSHKLFKYGVLPYYLHLLDPVTNSEHYEVSTRLTKKIYEEIRTELPGYLLPRLVKEVPGKSSKIPYELLDENTVN